MKHYLGHLRLLVLSSGLVFLNGSFLTSLDRDPTKAPGAAVAADQVDISKIFWCNDAAGVRMSPEQCVAARDLILANCTSCHTFVPVVKAQKNEAEWIATLEIHRPRVPDLSDQQLTQIRQYLIEHFNPNMPVPKLPPELEKLGSQQAS